MKENHRFRGLSSSLPELVDQRELLALVCLRQITIRYRRSLLGPIWIVLTPMLTALVMFLVFRSLFKPDDIGKWPFLAYIFSGITVFSSFSQASLETGSCLRSNAGILTRTGTAPEIFVIAPAVSSFVSILVSSLLLMLILAFYGQHSFGNLLTLLPTSLALVMLSLGVGALISHFSIQYEDATSVAMVAFSIFSYTIPSFYPVSIIPEIWRPLYLANPLVPILDMYRTSFGFPAAVDWPYKIYAMVFSLIVSLAALHSFRRRWPKMVSWL